MRLPTGNQIYYTHMGLPAWIDKERLLDQCREHSTNLPDRQSRIVLQTVKAATAPDAVHPMLEPRSLTDALAGLKTTLPDLCNH